MLSTHNLISGEGFSPTSLPLWLCDYMYPEIRGAKIKLPFPRATPTTMGCRELGGRVYRGPVKTLDEEIRL